MRLWSPYELQDLWPPNSPDQSNWLRNLEHNSAASPPVQNMNDLMQCLIDVWAGMKQRVIDDATDPRRKRLIPAFEPQEDILNIHM